MDKAAEELGPRFGAFFLATDEPEVGLQRGSVVFPFFSLRPSSPYAQRSPKVMSLGQVEELMLQRYGNRLMCHKKRSLCRPRPLGVYMRIPLKRTESM